MKIKIAFIISMGLILVLSPAAQGFDYTENFLEITDEGVFDAEGNTVPSLSSGVPRPSVPPFSSTDSLGDYEQTLLNMWGSQKTLTEGRLQRLKENLNQELQTFGTLHETIEETEDKLLPLEQEIKTLTDQIDLFNSQLRLTHAKIQNAEKAIAEKEITMKKLMEETQKAEVGLRSQEAVVLDYITLLYAEEAEFMDLYTQSASTLKLLLASHSVSENLLGKEYVSLMERSGRKVFYEAQQRYLALRESQAALLLSQTKLNRLYAALAQEKQIMEETRVAKKGLLEKTQGEKDRYEELLEESIRQQLESALAIQNMKDNIGLIESKLELLDEALEQRPTAFPPAVLLPDEEPSSDLFFDWPVPPRAITAYFKDPTYPKRWGEHNALDIRAPQFSKIRAPANGYVVEAKDNGFGYSYIILAHKRNLVTLYGHVYEILVKPGMLVEKGQVIGLTGGTPGTKGAGLQTTGPHLHFEVHEKGVPQDPLNYLPVKQLPIDFIPTKYREAIPGSSGVPQYP